LAVTDSLSDFHPVSIRIEDAAFVVSITCFSWPTYHTVAIFVKLLGQGIHEFTAAY